MKYIVEVLIENTADPNKQREQQEVVKYAYDSINAVRRALVKLQLGEDETIHMIHVSAPRGNEEEDEK